MGSRQTRPPTPLQDPLPKPLDGEARADTPLALDHRTLILGLISRLRRSGAALPRETGECPLLNRCFCTRSEPVVRHDPNLSYFGVSGKPGAVQTWDRGRTCNGRTVPTTHEGLEAEELRNLSEARREERRKKLEEARKRREAINHQRQIDAAA